MAVMPKNARQLCTKPELQLIRSSLATSAERLTPAQLRQKISRARKLRDKYRDLARRQRRESRGKQGPRGARPSQSNENTARKAEFFADTLDRFENILAGKTDARLQSASSATRSTRSARGKTGAKRAATSVSANAESATRGKKTTGRRKKVARKTRSTKNVKGKKTGGKKKSVGTMPSRSLPGRKTRRKAKAKKSRAARKDSHFAQTGLTKIRAHVRSKGRRRQARRDSR